MTRSDAGLAEQNWVLVHSMGKVGSYSVFKAVQATRKFRTLHTHQLNRKTIDRYSNVVETTPGHIKQSLQFLTESSPDDKIKIIIGIRDPMNRNISAFFENLEHFDLAYDGSYDTDKLIESFNQKYSHHVPVRWFETQVRIPLGLNLFEHNWGLPRRAIIGRFDVLIDRVEDSKNVRGKALKEFLDCPDLKLKRMNVGQEKPYSDLYSAFKLHYRPSSEMLDLLYKSDYVRFFYSAAERETLRGVWS